MTSLLNSIFLFTLIFGQICFSQVDQNVKTKVLQNIVNLHVANGGSTVDPTTGDNYIGTHTYAVAIQSKQGVNLSYETEGKTLSVQELEDFLEDHKNIIFKNNVPDILFQSKEVIDVCALGTWYNEDTNTSMIEVTRVTNNREYALSIGIENNQLYIFDLFELKEIEVPKDRK